MSTMVLKCKCKHEYQDKKYGNGMRVHNRTRKQSENSYAYRCTVCGDLKYVAVRTS